MNWIGIGAVYRSIEPKVKPDVDGLLMASLDPDGFTAVYESGDGGKNNKHSDVRISCIFKGPRKLLRSLFYEG